MMRCWVSEASDAGCLVAPVCGGGWWVLVGFLVLDYWIVDASITHEYLVPWLALPLVGLVGWGMVYECVCL